MENHLRTYCLCKSGTERYNRMKYRIDTLGLDVSMVEWMDKDWLIEKNYQRFSCQWGHIKILKQFLEDIKNIEDIKKDIYYCCVIEDDVYISKDFECDTGFLLNKMKTLNLDVLLVGYLIDCNPINTDAALSTTVFCKYNDQLWGSQGYIVTKSYAEYIVKTYDEKYLDKFIQDNQGKPFSPDWTITKDGKGALVYPMYFVEEGVIADKHPGQVRYHESCHRFNYKKDKYI